MLIFPDTNFFLQCRDPAEIPWHEVTLHDEVRLLVCRTVQTEIDRLKGDSRGRRADRSRRVSTWLASVVRDGSALALRAAGPRVTLDLAPRVPPSHVYPASLDLARNDDRIVGEVVAHAGPSYLLTGDTGMMLTARVQGLPYLEMPDTWRLPAEPDARDRQIAEMRKLIEIHERASPKLTIVADYGDRGAALIGRVRYAPLPAETVDELVDAMLVRFQAKSDFSWESDPSHRVATITSALRVGGGIPTEWRPPAPEAVAKYLAAHDAWSRAVRDGLGNLHRRLPGVTGTTGVKWTITNEGTVPAEGLVVGIEALGGLQLAERSALASLEGPAAGLPAAPAPPSWEGVRGPSPLTPAMRAVLEGRVAAQLGNPFPVGPYVPTWERHVRDPRKFRWRDKPVRTLVARWDFECADFRHGATPEVFETVVVAPAAMEGGSGAIRFHASGRNVPSASERTVRVEIETSEGDTVKAARLMVSRLQQYPGSGG